MGIGGGAVLTVAALVVVELVDAVFVWLVVFRCRAREVVCAAVALVEMLVDVVCALVDAELDE